MGTIKVSIPDENEEKFRKAAMSVFGHKRGSISKAAEEAMEEWADKNLEDGLNLSEGLGDFLSQKSPDTDKSAVELQEELGDAYEEQVLN